MQKVAVKLTYNLPMTVYVEYVFLDNFALDFVILWGVTTTLKLNIKWYKLTLASVVGALCAIASVLVRGVWVYIVKMLCLFAMCVTAVGLGKKLLWFTLLTVVYTFALGGAIVGVFGLFNVQYLQENGQFFALKVPLFAYIAGICLVAVGVWFLTQVARRNKKILPFVVQATLHLGKDVVVNAFCDSGNTVTHYGVGVCFVVGKIDGFTAFFAHQALQQKYAQVEVCTLSGQRKMPAVRTNITVNGVTSTVYLAVSGVRLDLPYQLILYNGVFCQGA